MLFQCYSRVEFAPAKGTVSCASLKTLDDFEEFAKARCARRVAEVTINPARAAVYPAVL